jgi:hypothetical protein
MNRKTIQLNKGLHPWITTAFILGAKGPGSIFWPNHFELQSSFKQL